MGLDLFGFKDGVDLSLQPRSEIRDLKISEHGGLNYSELETLGLSPNEVIDFSVSSNPNGPPLPESCQKQGM